MPKLHFQNFDEQITRMIKNPLEKLPEITELEFFSSPTPINGMYLIKNSEGVSFLPSEEDYTILSTVSEEETKYHSMAIAMRNTKNTPSGSDVFITHAIYLKGDSSGREFPPKPSDWVPIGEKIEVVANLDSDSDLKALSASMGLKIKSYLSQIGTFDTGGNFTPNAVVKTVNSQSPDENGNIQIETGAIDAYTKVETDAKVSAVQTNIDTHADNNDIHTTLADKTKLDGIQDGANKYTLPIATNTELGGVKVDNDSLTIETDGTIKAKVSPSNISGMVKKVNNKLPNTNGEVTLVANDLDAYNKSEINTELDKKIDKIDIVDNLTTSNSAKPLSASQGKILKDSIDSITKDFVGLAHPYYQMFFDWQNGNDANAGTNANIPKKDVVKFLQTLNHKKLDSYLVIRLVNYNTTITGSITLTGMSGGYIRIIGDTANPINLVNGKINVTNCSNKIELQYLGAGMGFNIENCHNVSTYGIFAKDTTFGMINKGSGVYNVVPVFDNCKYGIWTTENGRTFAFQPKGSSIAPNSNIGFSGGNGGYIRVFQNKMTGYGVMTKIENGARVELV